MKRCMLRTVLVALPAVLVASSASWAADATIYIGSPDRSAPVVVQAAPPPVVVQPTPPAPVVVQPTPPAPVVVQPTPPAPVVVQPTPPAPVVVTPPASALAAPETMVADDIHANQVRAKTI